MVESKKRLFFNSIYKLLFFLVDLHVRFILFYFSSEAAGIYLLDYVIVTVCPKNRKKNLSNAAVQNALS